MSDTTDPRGPVVLTSKLDSNVRRSGLCMGVMPTAVGDFYVILEVSESRAQEALDSGDQAVATPSLYPVTGWNVWQL